MELVTLVVVGVVIIMVIVSTIMCEKQKVPGTNPLSSILLVIYSLILTRSVILDFGLLGVIVGFILLMTTFMRVGFYAKYIVNKING